MEFDEVVRKRRMVHRFEQMQVPANLLELVLEKALHAPSAGFSQGVEFVVLREPSVLEAFWRTTAPDRSAEEVLAISSAGPPTVVLAYVDTTAYTSRYAEPDKIQFGLNDPDRWTVPFWFVDAGMSVMLILQAAVDRGLGAWFFGVSEGEQELRESLGIPPGLRAVGVIGIGYKAADDRPVGSAVARPRRPLTDVLHFERW